MPQNRLAHQVVANRYELLERVGQGGFGVVWRARDTLLERHVALKEVQIPDRVDLRDRVLREARAAARLDHPGAVTVFDVLDDDGQPVIVMELVEAPNLSQLVAGQGHHGPLAPTEAARIGIEILDVLDAAHARGIVHRDVKPGNVLVGPGDRVRLGDFGVAAILDDPTVSTSGAVIGSPAYMAPEQATSRGAVPESDLWSLGATLYFAVEGRPPFDKGAPLPTLASIVQDPPRPAERAGALGPVLDALLVKDLQARLRSGPLRDRLAQVLTAAPPAPAAPPVTPPPAPPALAPPPVARLARPRRRPDLVPWAAGLIALLVVALIGIGLAAGGADPPGGEAPGGTAPGAGTGSTIAGGGGTRSAATPSHWVAYTDAQTGFTIAHPPEWTVRTSGTLTDFRDPGTGAYLRVDHVQPPKPSPEGAWQELEPSFAAENANYRRIRIEPTTYAGYRAAIWEFTYRAGGADLRAADLGFITPGYGFALYFQTREGDWDRLQPVFQAFKSSFRAPA